MDMSKCFSSEIYVVRKAIEGKTKSVECVQCIENTYKYGSVCWWMRPKQKRKRACRRCNNNATRIDKPAIDCTKDYASLLCLSSKGGVVLGILQISHVVRLVIK